MDQIMNILETWSESGVLGTIGVAILIVAVTLISMVLVVKALRKLFTREGSVLPSSTIFVSLSRVLILVIGASVLCKVCFDVDLYAVFAALGIGGLALSLGMQDTISNLIAGVLISLLGNVLPGDFVEINNRRGFVHDVSLRYTTITTLTGETVVIPNSVINSNALVKIPDPTTVKVPFFVINLERNLDDVAFEITEQIKARVGGIDKEAGAPSVLYTSITEFAFGGTLTFYIKDPDDYLAARDVAVRVISASVGKQTKTQSGEYIDSSAAFEIE